LTFPFSQLFLSCSLCFKVAIFSPLRYCRSQGLAVFLLNMLLDLTSFLERQLVPPYFFISLWVLGIFSSPAVFSRAVSCNPAAPPLLPSRDVTPFSFLDFFPLFFFLLPFLRYEMILSTPHLESFRLNGRCFSLQLLLSTPDIFLRFPPRPPSSVCGSRVPYSLPVYFSSRCSLGLTP